MLIKNLSSQDNKEATEKIQALFVITLHDSNGTNGVSITPAKRNPTIGKDGDDDMLLHVEGPRIQAKATSKKTVLLGWKNPGHELANGQDRDLHEDCRDGEWLRTVGEESVEKD